MAGHVANSTTCALDFLVYSKRSAPLGGRLGGGVGCGWVFGLGVGGAGAWLGGLLVVGSGGLGAADWLVCGLIGRQDWPTVCVFIFVACVCLSENKKTTAAVSAPITSFEWH